MSENSFNSPDIFHTSFLHPNEIKKLKQKHLKSMKRKNRFKNLVDRAFLQPLTKDF